MDRILIRDLALRCIIGIYPEERRARQDVVLNLALECDTRRAAARDRIEDAVDYKEIKRRVIQHVEASSHNLVETLADRVASLCLADPRVRRVTVTIDKPGALRFARSVAVETVRTQHSPRRRRTVAGRPARPEPRRGT